MYSFDDSPYFSFFNIYDLVALIFVGCITILLIKYANTIENKLSYKWVTLIFIIIAICYIILIPLKPFSDMQYVWQGAVDFSNLNLEKIYTSQYLQTFKANIKLSVILGMFLFVLPKYVISLKLINVLFLLGISIFSAKTIENLNWRYPKLVFTCILFFLPVFLYINHIYFDLLFLFIVSLVLFIYTKNRSQIIISLLILGIAYILRINAFIYLVAILIDYVFIQIKNDVQIKKIFTQILLGIIAFMSVGQGGSKLISYNLYNTEILSYPRWNQFYIGINKEEFGFMDGDFDYNRTANDVINRMIEYGPIGMIEIYAKKNLWAWSEGTYQSSRYAFGVDTEIPTDKFEYPTILTKYVMVSSQKTRKMITALSRLEYLAFAFFMVLASLQKYKHKSDARLLYLVFILTIGILTFYELKSRYILHCSPLMVMMALQYDKSKVILKYRK